KNIIDFYHNNENWHLESYLAQVPRELSDEITSIIMDNERYELHDWEKQNIFVKGKDLTVSQYVNETILTLQSYLIFEIEEGLKKQIQEKPEKARDLLTDVVDYNQLKGTFSNQLGRVMSRFNRYCKYLQGCKNLAGFFYLKPYFIRNFTNGYRVHFMLINGM